MDGPLHLLLLPGVSNLYHKKSIKVIFNKKLIILYKPLVSQFPYLSTTFVVNIFVIHRKLNFRYSYLK